MRSLLAGMAVFLAFLNGTVGLGAYVVHDVVLDPARAGQVVDYALHQPDTRREILDKVVPGYGRLPVRVRARVDALADFAAVRRAARAVALDGDGKVVLTPLQNRFAAELQAIGQPRVAARVAAAEPRVAVPGQYVSRYQVARTDSAAIARGAALATAVLVVLALLVSRRRTRMVGILGVETLLACVIVAVLYWALPSLISAASSSPLVGAVEAVVQTERSTVLVRLAPFFGAGVLLLAIGLVARPAPPQS